MPGQQQEKAFFSQSGFYNESLCSSMLSSTSAITDANGSLTQHVLYFAYGEQFVDEHRNSTNSPYLYNGKELDTETGRYYYGARYYDPKVSLWIGVDPMAGKYYRFSPYNYCANNPILLTDPKGDTINVSDALINDEIANNAFNAWYNSKEGQEFRKLYDNGGKYEGVSVNFGIDSREVGNAKGDLKMYGVNKAGVKRSLMELGSGLEKGEYLRFEININPGEKVKEGMWGAYDDNLVIMKHTSETAMKANYMSTINKASFFLHEQQHVELVHMDIRKDNSYDIHPYYQHQIMKNPKYKFYHQRKNFYQRLNIYNLPYDPNGFDD